MCLHEFYAPRATRRDVLAGALTIGAALATPVVSVARETAEPRPADPPSAPKFEVITLGTGGGPILRKERSNPANAILLGNDVILVDVGEGVLQRMAQADIALQSVNAIYLTHLHSDHVGALFAILTVRWHLGFYKPLKIYGPPGTRYLVSGLIAADQPVNALVPPRTHDVDVDPNHTDQVVEVDPRGGNIAAVADPTFDRVLAVQNSHFCLLPKGTGVSVAYRFEYAGRSVVFTGDTGPSEPVEKLATDADLMIGELVDLDLLRSQFASLTAYSPEVQARLLGHFPKVHLTPEALGAMAAGAHVKALVASHLIPGMHDNGRVLSYLRAIGETYNGPTVIARDLDRFPLSVTQKTREQLSRPSPPT